MAHGHAMMIMIMISWPMAAETACGRDGGWLLGLG
jgi:hypothetical protein